MDSRFPFGRSKELDNLITVILASSASPTVVGLMKVSFIPAFSNAKTRLCTAVLGCGDILTSTTSAARAYAISYFCSVRNMVVDL